MEQAHSANMVPHSEQERPDVLKRRGMNKLSVVEPQADPEIIHEQGEPSHNGRDT